MDIDNLITNLRNGDKRMLARAITLVENGDSEADELLRGIYQFTGNAIRIGITGPPGAGKSTLTTKITGILRAQNKKIGIVAVDPTSPFTGGAVLGDRIRMVELSTDPGVFIRSMATRGSLGGLSATAQDVADLLDAAGIDIIIFETVGVGQGELDVARAADTTLVVLVPESGDSIQAMKAGLMEIADVFVVNKADREGAEKMRIELESVLQFRSGNDHWLPPILMTVGNKNEGIEELVNTMMNHHRYMIDHGGLRDKRFQRIMEKIQVLVRRKLEKDYWTPRRVDFLNGNIQQVIKAKIPPISLVEKLMNIK